MLSVHSQLPIFCLGMKSSVHDFFHCKLLITYLIIYLYYRKKCLKFNE